MHNTLKSKVIVYGQKIISILLILCFIIHWQIFPSIFAVDLTYQIVVLTWLFLSLSTAIGLWLNKVWGFWFLYPYLIYTPIALGMPVIPLFTNLFPIAARIWILIATNMAMLVFGIWLHKQHKNQSSHTQ